MPSSSRYSGGFQYAAVASITERCDTRTTGAARVESLHHVHTGEVRGKGIW
jgi:hypothetical protein